jgi:hypothetical protein
MSGDPEELDSMVRTARKNLSRHGVDVGRPAGTRSIYFVSPEFSYEHQTNDEVNVARLIRANNSIDFTDVAIAAYNFEHDEIVVNHGLIKTYLLGLISEARQDLYSANEDLLRPENPGEYYLEDRLEDILPTEAFDAWIGVKNQAHSLGLDVEHDFNFAALRFDILRYESEQAVRDELNSIYRRQVVTDVEHELLHKHQFDLGIQPHIGEIVNTIWSVERAPLYELLNEVTDKDLDISEMAIDSIMESERLGYEGLAADAVEFLEVYNSFRGDEQERLRQLMALQYEFVPRYEPEDDGILRSILKGLVIRAVLRLLF